MDSSYQRNETNMGNRIYKRCFHGESSAYQSQSPDKDINQLHIDSNHPDSNNEEIDVELNNNILDEDKENNSTNNLEKKETKTIQFLQCTVH